MKSSILTKSSKAQSPPRRPHPDQTSSPDRIRKTNILNTSSPKIEQTQLNKSNLHQDLRAAKKQNKKLEQQNLKLSDRNKQFKLEINTLKDENKQLKDENKVLREQTTSLLGSDYRGVSITKESFYKNLEQGKPKKIAFQSFTKQSQQYILQQFNRQMVQLNRLYENKLNDVEFRLDKISSSHKKVCEYLVDNKIDQINIGLKKNNSFQSPSKRQSINKKDDQIKESKTAIKHQGKHKNLLKELETELLFVKNQNKQLIKELKMRDSLIKQQVVRNRGRNHSLEDIRKKSYSKVSIADFYQSKNYDQLKTQYQKVIDELEKQRNSKDKSERALEVIQNNYQLSQQNLEFMRKQNQKLKQANWKITKQLQNNKKITQKMSQSLIRLDTVEDKKQRFSQYLNKPNLKVSQSSPSPPRHNNNNSISYDEEILILKNKNKRLQFENQQLYLLRRKNQDQNITLYEQIRTLENAVDKYLYSPQQYKSQRGLESSRKRDVEFEMIQQTLEGITEKLKAIKRDIRGEY